MRFQNGKVIDLAILKPGFELARPFQNQGRFQNGQVNNLAVSKRPMAILKRPGFRNGREQCLLFQHSIDVDLFHLGWVKLLFIYLL